jgi:DNA (cytosine-5)-methyltransferase 1
MIGGRVDVLAQPQFGNVQFHLAAKPGRIEPPESFRDKHGLDDPEQAGLEGFTESPETVDEMLEQIIENGMEVMQ